MIFICDFDDDYVKKLQHTIQKIKVNREMGERFMIWEEMMEQAKIDGKVESVLDFLSELGEIPEELENIIESERNSEVLMGWMKIAIQSRSIEEFTENM